MIDKTDVHFKDKKKKTMQIKTRVSHIQTVISEIANIQKMPSDLIKPKSK